MGNISYVQVQELVKRLPEERLTVAYYLLLELTQKADTPTPQRAFLRLRPSERYEILARQAEQMKVHYEQAAEDRREWQVGDFCNLTQR